MRYFGLIFCFGLFIFLGNSEVVGASSGYKVGLCDGCTEGARQQAAINVSGLNAGRIYIIDRFTLQIYPFQVMVLNEPDLFQVSAFEIAGVSEEIGDIQEALDVYVFLASAQSIGASELPFSGGPNVPTSAFDVPGNPTAQAHIRDAVSNYVTNGLQGGITSVATSILSIILNDDLHAAITVVFPDGTSYQLVYTHTTIDAVTGELTFHYEIVDDSGRDANGELIPDSADGIHPGFTRATGSAESWGELLERIGFNPTGSEWRHGTGGLCLSCTWEAHPDGGTLSCQRC